MASPVALVPQSSDPIARLVAACLWNVQPEQHEIQEGAGSYRLPPGAPESGGAG